MYFHCLSTSVLGFCQQVAPADGTWVVQPSGLSAWRVLCVLRGIEAVLRPALRQNNNVPRLVVCRMVPSPAD